MRTSAPSDETSPLDPADAHLDLEGRQVLRTVLSRLTGCDATLRIGRYRLAERIGMGGCGVVYAAHDPKLDRRVAIKWVLPSLTGKDEDVSEARLLREAQALAKLGHPNVVEIFDIGVDHLDDDRSGARRGVYIVMELIEGPTLREWLTERPRSRREIVAAFVDAACGLAAAHSVGVVHRDFKPANAIVGPRGIKVLDFGLALHDLEAAQPASLKSSGPVGSGTHDSLTRTGAVMGTPRYMAPEQHAACPAIAASDQYALCVALWEALHGRPPFEAKRMSDLAELKRAGPPRRPAEVSRAMYAVLARGLDPEPNRRFASMTELAERLRTAGRTRLRPAWAGLACASALTFALAGTLASSSPMPPLCTTSSPVADWQARIVPTVEASYAALAIEMPARIEARLWRYADAWAEQRDTTCDPDAAVTATERNARAACLGRGAAQLDTILAGLAADPKDPSSRRRLFSLPVPSRCAHEDAELINARDELTELELDAFSRLARQVLDRERACDEQTVAELDAAIARVDEIGDHWVAVQLLLARVQRDVMSGNSAEAARRTAEAMWRAEAANDPLLAAELLPNAVMHLSEADPPREEIERLLAHGDDLVIAAGDPIGPRVELEATRALHAVRVGALEGALAAAHQAIAYAGDPPAPGTERPVGTAIGITAEYRVHLGESASVVRDLKGVIARGPTDAKWYPRVAAIAYDAWSSIALNEGDYDTAIATKLAQLRLLEGAAGPEHPGVLFAAARYGRIIARAGADREGIALMERSYARIIDTQGSIDAKLAVIASDIVQVERLRGDYGRMRKWAERALEHQQSRLGVDAPSLAPSWLDLAEASVHEPDLATTETALTHAFALLPADGTGTKARAHHVRALLHLSRAQYDLARADASLALATFGRHGRDPLDHGFRGELYRVLAAALRGAGDSTQAEAIDRLADEAFSHATIWHRR